MSPPIADLRRRWQSAQAEYRRMSGLDLPDDEIEPAFDAYLDGLEATLDAHAETWGDLIAQHEALLAGNAGYDEGGLGLSLAEEQWIIGLGDTIRRLAGIGGRSEAHTSELQSLLRL